MLLHWRKLRHLLSLPQKPGSLVLLRKRKTLWLTDSQKQARFLWWSRFSSPWRARNLNFQMKAVLIELQVIHQPTTCQPKPSVAAQTPKPLDFVIILSLLNLKSGYHPWNSPSQTRIWSSSTGMIRSSQLLTLTQWMRASTRISKKNSLLFLKPLKMLP